jgi:methylase of polypeptide subunit release factors
VRTNIFKYLKSFHSTQPADVDRLIISAFLHKNKLTVKKNEFLKSFVIPESKIEEYDKLKKFISVLEKEIPKFGTEELIELFEFVISPEDRVITGAIYTPIEIRKFIIKESFEAKKDSLTTSKIADISCGCGGFLFNAAKQLKKQTSKSYSEIFRNQIFGLDIQSYSITRTKLLLTILALTEGEDKNEFYFNLYTGDALVFEWERKINGFKGFEIILGNPPYVCSRHISDETKEKLKKWEVCKSGHPDLYIPFFQIGISNLNQNGVLGFITMNSFFKSLNGRALREYFQKHRLKFKIIDFGAAQIFKSKNTYTCICLIENDKQEFIKYVRAENKNLQNPEKAFSKINYVELNAKEGWNLQDNVIISKIESTGVSFGELYKTRHGIATLRNDVYIFKPVKEDDDYYYLQNGSLYQIEKGICKDIVNSNKLSRPSTLGKLIKKVIFPYDDGNKPKLLDEQFLKANFPKAYQYLESKRNLLAERDKGKGKYENWYAFGRTQSLEKMKNKLFFPKMADQTPNYIINADDNLLFYNGLAIVGGTKRELTVIKKILESKVFWFYIQKTSKPYASNYYSLNGNYIRNFGICNLDKDEIEFVVSEQDKQVLDKFFEKKYDLEAYL